MYNQKGNVLLIVLLITAAIGGYLIYSGKINLPQKQTPQTEISKVDETANEQALSYGNWKTYTIQKISFSMKYPSNWQVTEKKYDQNNEEVIFSGSEGQISFRSGTGFGGGCPFPIMVKISNEELPGCQSEDGQTFSFGKITNIPFELRKGVMDKLSVSVVANIASPVQVNKKVILDVIATFKFQ